MNEYPEQNIEEARGLEIGSDEFEAIRDEVHQKERGRLLDGGRHHIFQTQLRPQELELVGLWRQLDEENRKHFNVLICGCRDAANRTKTEIPAGVIDLSQKRLERN